MAAQGERADQDEPDRSSTEAATEQPVGLGSRLAAAAREFGLAPEEFEMAFTDLRDRTPVRQVDLN